MTGDHHGRPQRDSHRDHERGAFAGPPSSARPAFAATPPTAVAGLDPGLPILRELEDLVRAAAVAAGAAAPATVTAAMGAGHPAATTAAGAGRPAATTATVGTGQPAATTTVGTRHPAATTAGHPAAGGPDRLAADTSASPARRPLTQSGFPNGRSPAPVRCLGGGTLRGIVPRGLVLALLACTVGATATALTRNGAAPDGDGPAVTVLRGAAGAVDWRLQVARRGGRLCVSLTATGPTVAGASVDPDCQAAPARRMVVPRTFVAADRVIVHGLAGASVRAVAVTLDGSRRTRRSVPVPGAGSTRAFALVFRRRPTSSATSVAGPEPRVRPLDREGHRLGPALRDCSAAACSPERRAEPAARGSLSTSRSP